MTRTTGHEWTISSFLATVVLLDELIPFAGWRGHGLDSVPMLLKAGWRQGLLTAQELYGLELFWRYLYPTDQSYVVTSRGWY